MSNTMTLDDLDAIVAEVPETKPEKAGKIPVIPCSPELADRVARFIGHKQRAAEEAALEKSVGTEIKREAEALRVQEARKSGAITSSIVLGDLRYTVQQKFTPITADAFPEISSAFASDFERFIRIDVSYSLDRAALLLRKSDPEVVAAFTTLRKKGILPQTRTGRPTETLYRQMTFDDNVRAQALGLGLVPQAMLASVKAVSR